MLIGGALVNALAFIGSRTREPVSSDYYTPTDEQHYREFGFIALSMIGIGGVLYYFES